MRCTNAQLSIERYLDQSLAGDNRKALEHHLEECRECSRELRTATRLRDSMRRMPSRTVSPAFDQQLQRAVSASRPAPAAWLERLRLRTEWRFRGPMVLTAGSLAAAVIAAVVTPGVMTARTEREAQRRDFVQSAVNRHAELKESSSVDWDAVDSSIELSTGDILTEGQLTP